MATIIKSLMTKKGKTVLIRYSKKEDLPELTDYINSLSQEDTFILFSGEQVELKEEEKYLQDNLEKVAKGDKVHLVCEIEGKIVGVSDVSRDFSKRKRSQHLAVFGISLKPEFRGEGLGKVFAETAIEEAKKRIDGLKAIILDVFAINNVAIELYKKLGFQEVGKIPGGILYRGGYVDLITMWRKI